jgi:ketosteroid isomerase-like protein
MGSMRSWRGSLDRRFFGVLVAIVLGAWPVFGQDGAEQKAALAVAEAALAAITRGDTTALTDLMLPEAVMFPTSTRDGVTRYRLRTRAEQRAATTKSKVTERGFRPDVRVNGPLAMVWFPYDLYVDGKWSHCGVDVFTLIRTDGQWRIATMSWSAEQPPVCEKHPDGPPKS